MNTSHPKITECSCSWRTLWLVGLLAVLMLCAAAGSSHQASAGARAAPSSELQLYAVRIKQPQKAQAERRLARSQLRAAAGYSPLAARAAEYARSSRHRRSSGEGRLARQIERSRTRALAAFARAMAPNVAAQERVARLIYRLGGKLEPEGSGIGVLRARLSAAMAAQLAKSPAVYSLSPAAEILPMGQMNADTWHAAGLTGQITGANSPGGIDVGVLDMGITVAHRAFKSRLPGDCATCSGSGASRIVSPSWRAESPSGVNGTRHANAIAATIAATDFAAGGSGEGLAYGIDKLEDPVGAMNTANWLLGVPWKDPLPPYTQRQGSADPVEIINRSAGNYEDQLPSGYNPDHSWIDAISAQLGVLWVNAAGNCGKVEPPLTGYDNCVAPNGVPHRVISPSNLYNVLTVGGSSSCSGAPAQWCVWANSSSGPTYDGRKKPDIIAAPWGTTSHPLTFDDDHNGQLDDYHGAGLGTSFAAPIAVGAAALLASTGVSAPIAQRAILINSAAPIQGQNYWTPTSGWGMIDLDAAFYARGNYALGSVTNGTAAAPNANRARFFSVSGAQVGDKTTLVWNRRNTSVFTPGGVAIGNYYALTNLNLSQFDPNTQAVTSTGGDDAADTVDSNTTASGFPGNFAPTDNPMPGDGRDGGDNVEQIRSSAGGNQIIKVKSQTAVDGADEEPFALASARPVSALDSPIPQVALVASQNTAGAGEDVQITATVTNPSSDLPLSGASLTFAGLPAGVELKSGQMNTNLGTLAPGASAAAAITIARISDGNKTISAGASGSAYGEPFAGGGEVSVLFDGSAPELSLSSLPEWSTEATPQVSWSADDQLSDIAGYDVEQRAGDGAWSRTQDLGSGTAANISAGEGQRASLRVRAVDALGNVSGWQEVGTSIDAVPPVISFGASNRPSRGVVSVPVAASNVGVPIVASEYSFGRGGGALMPLSGAAPRFENDSLNETRATLHVRVRDTLGRTVERSEGYNADPRWISPHLVFSRIKVKRRRATLRASLARDYPSRVSVEIERRGKRGTKRIRRRVAVRDGKIKLTVRLKAGRYWVSITAARSGDYDSRVKVRSLRVR